MKERTEAQVLIDVDSDEKWKPALIDQDNDGDVDLWVGVGNTMQHPFGMLYYFENVGNTSHHSFIQRKGTRNPMDGINVGQWANPTLGDQDNDGDYDMYIGAENFVLYFENTGNASHAVFTERKGKSNPMDGKKIDGQAVPVLVDIDNDNDEDMFVGCFTGKIMFFENVGNKTNPSFRKRRQIIKNPMHTVDVGSHAKPALLDQDNDGDYDMFVGNKHGDLFYFENTGSATNPAFTQRTGQAHPMNGINVGAFAAPVAIDQGNLYSDLWIGNNFGKVLYFENVVSVASDLVYTERMGENNMMNDFNEYIIQLNLDLYNRGAAADGSFFDWLFRNAKPTLIDQDDDGDSDLWVGVQEGSIFYFENVGNKTNAIFEQRLGTQNPMNGINVGPGSAPTLADQDNGTTHFYDPFLFRLGPNYLLTLFLISMCTL